MDGLDLLRAFREVAERGSFSRAAKVLGMSKATVSKYVAQLEDALRRAAAQPLDPLGQPDRCRPAAARAQQAADGDGRAHADRASGRTRATRRGRLRITAPHGMGPERLAGLLGEFIDTYPDVHVSLHLSNRVIDLVEEGVDVALRLGRIRDENLIVRRLLPDGPGAVRRARLLGPARPAEEARRHAPARRADLLARRRRAAPALRGRRQAATTCR